MVCAKCQKHETALATPAVKRKSELYYGSSAKENSSTAGNNGVSKASIESRDYYVAHVC